MDSDEKRFLFWFAVAVVVFGVVGKILHDNEVQKENEKREEIEALKRRSTYLDSLLQRAKRIWSEPWSRPPWEMEMMEHGIDSLEASSHDDEWRAVLKTARRKLEAGKRYWYDPKFGVVVAIKRVGGTYYLHIQDGVFGDGEYELETWHSSMPHYGHKNLRRGGRIFVMVDRIGAPAIYYVLTETGDLDVYLNCEFGPCSYDRTMRETAKPIYDAP